MKSLTSPELPDLDHLEALADAATPGIWEAQRHGVIVAGPMRQYVNGSARSQIACFSGTFHEDDADDEPERKEANTEFCAALRPEVVKQLIALARRAQPEGEAPQAVAPKRLEGREIFEIAAPYFAWNAPSWHKATQGAVGMTGLLAFAEALLKAVSAAQHAEAPQAGNALAVAVERHYPHTETQRQLDQRAAFIKGYQAAQHAESGAQVAKNPHHDYLARYWQLGFDGQSMVACSGDKPLAAYNNGKKARAALAAQSQGAQALPAAGAGDPDLDAARWAEVFYRNAETFTVRDLSIVRDAWKEATRRSALAAKAEAPATGDLTLLASLADAADVFMNGGVALLRPLIDRAKAVTSGAQQAAAPGALDESAYQRGYLDGMAKGRRDAIEDAAPGALAADEMTRLRRLMRALGMDGSMNTSDEYVRGVMCTVLGQAAGKIERAASAPGTPEAPALLMQALTTGIPLQEPVYIAKALRAQREARVSLAGGTGPSAAVFLVNIQMTPWTHTAETAEAYAEGYNRATKDYRAALLDVAAQLDGGQGEGERHA